MKPSIVWGLFLFLKSVMESIILTISIIIGAFSPTQLLEKMTFTDLEQAQSQLDSIATMNLTDSEKAKYHFFQGYVHANKMIFNEQ